MTLPAGKYIFRLADPNSSRKVIAIQSEDGKKQLAMLHTIPNQAPKAPNDPEIRFMETSSNVPPPVKTWWYPGQVDRLRVHLPAGAGDAAREGDHRTRADDHAGDHPVRERGPVADLGPGRAGAVTVEETPAPAAVAGRAQAGRGSGRVAGRRGALSQDTRADERARTTARTELPQTAEQRARP